MRATCRLRSSAENRPICVKTKGSVTRNDASRCRRAPRDDSSTEAPSRPVERGAPSPLLPGAAQRDSMVQTDPDPFDGALGLDGPLLEALAGMPVPMWLVDRRGHIRWMSVAAASLLGSKIGSHFSG